MPQTLFEIAAELRAVLDKAEESGGELTEDLLAEMDRVQFNLDSKADNYCALMQEWQLRAAVAKENSERLAKRAGVLTRNVERLKERLRSGMAAAGVKRVDTPLFTVRRQNNAPSCQYAGPADMKGVPPEFVRVVPEKREPDKVAVLKHYKATGQLPEHFTVNQTDSLRVE